MHVLIHNYLNYNKENIRCKPCDRLTNNVLSCPVALVAVCFRKSLILVGHANCTTTKRQHAFQQLTWPTAVNMEHAVKFNDPESPTTCKWSVILQYIFSHSSTTLKEAITDIQMLIMHVIVNSADNIAQQSSSMIFITWKSRDTIIIVPLTKIDLLLHNKFHLLYLDN